MEYRTPILVAFTLVLITFAFFYYKKRKEIKAKQMEEALRFADFRKKISILHQKSLMPAAIRI